MSPFSRFYNLTDDKQKKILESAVSEFTQRGFDGASLNQIISTAGLSKGSFYYYFENKIDLLVGVLEAFFSPDFIIILDELKQSSDATKFWSIFRNVSIKQVAKWFDNPWGLKLLGFIVGLPDHVTSSNQMTNYMEKWMGVLATLIEHGQNIGALRSDLPMPVIQKLWMSNDQIITRWMVKEWEQSTMKQREKLIDLSIGLFRRLFSPVVD